MLSVLQQIKKEIPSSVLQQIGKEVEQPTGQPEINKMAIPTLFPFTTKDTKDIGTSAPVQEVQEPKKESVLSQLFPKEYKNKVEPQTISFTGSSPEISEKPKTSGINLFGGQLSIG